MSRAGRKPVPAPQCSISRALAVKLSPASVPGYSPTMYRIMGAFTGVGVPHGTPGLDSERQPGPPRYTALSITSDGFVIATPGRRESGDFIGSAEDLERNVRRYVTDAGLTGDEEVELCAAVRGALSDFRPIVCGGETVARMVRGIGMEEE